MVTCMSAFIIDILTYKTNDKNPLSITIPCKICFDYGTAVLLVT